MSKVYPHEIGAAHFLTVLSMTGVMVMAGFAAAEIFTGEGSGPSRGYLSPEEILDTPENGGTGGKGSSITSMAGSQPLATGPGSTSFPDDDPDSGKFLGVAGSGTLVNVPIICHIGVPAGESTFTVEIFDGDIGGLWDQWYDDSDFMDFKLYKDPLKDGTGSSLKGNWNHFMMSDDGWFSRTFSTDSGAQAPSGNYFYRLEIQWRNPGTSTSNNYFKVRTSGQISITEGDQFAFMGGPMDIQIPYGPPPWESQGFDPPVWAGDPNPNVNNVDANSYDGDWKFYFYVPTTITEIEFWDGDSDYRYDVSSPGAPRDGPSPYDGCNVNPNIYYYVTDPNGATYYNYDPSGNLEWEPFTITGTLPPGLWEMRYKGVDAHNMNFLEASHEIFSTPDPPLPVSPPPVVEPDNSRTVVPGVTVDYAHWIRNDGAPATFDLKASSDHGWTTRIYRDANANGNLDPSEISAGVIGDTGPMAKNAIFHIIVQVVVPSSSSSVVDKTTVTASSQEEWNIQDSAVDTTTVVANRPPVADAGGPYYGTEGHSIQLDGSGTTDPDGDSLYFKWDLDNDGQYDDSTLVKPSYTWNRDGTYTIRLWVYDGKYTDTDTATVYVSNLAPDIDNSLPKSVQIGEGSAASLKGAARDWGSDDLILSFQFLWNDPHSPGATSSGTTPWNTQFSRSHIYYEDGTYFPVLTVTDSDGATDTLTYTVTVSNIAPSVNAGPDLTINEGSSVSPTGTFSDPGAYDTHIASWNWGDGSSDAGSVTEENIPPYSTGSVTGSHSYNDDGIYTVRLTVVDDESGTGVDTLTVYVLDLAPTADFSWSPEPQDEGSPVQFTDLSTSSPDVIVAWKWEFGDGKTSTQKNPSHIYMDDGSYPVTLTVTDDDGSTGAAILYVTVLDLAPTANFSWSPNQQDEGAPVMFTDLSTSYPDIIVAWNWEFGDGGSSTLQNPSHAYGDNGVYTVTLTVTDDDGSTSSVSHSIVINNVAPVVDAGEDIATDEGATVQFSGGFFDPGWLDNHTILWDFGDGNTALGTLTPTHVYGDDGVFLVTLTVTDDDGASDSDTITVTVNNLAPSVAFSGPFEVNENSQVVLGGYATDPGSDDLTFTWVLEYGPTLTTVHYNDGTGPDPDPSPDILPMDLWDYVSHTYGDNGEFNVTLTVEDDDGGVVAASTTVTVRNLDPTIIPHSTHITDENSAIVLSGTATDQGSDDLTFTWEWGDGTSDTVTIYFNDGLAPDPMPSPEINNIDITDLADHTYGDNGVFPVTLTVRDDDGGQASHTYNVTVNNVAPSLVDLSAYMKVNFTLRVAGEKWHSVAVRLYENGVEIWDASVTREPGDPDEQSASVTGVNVDMTKTYTALVDYLPNDPRVNGNVWGGNPVWIVIDYEDGSQDRIHHTFNVRQSQWDSDHWNHIDPWEVEFAPHFGGHNITFEASVTDPGSDDLTFSWDFDDGNTAGSTYFNNGMGPDPFPSPEINPISVTDSVQNQYTASGTYTVTLTVSDDDGGTSSFAIVLVVVFG